jgi:hypothetical protein
MAVSYDNSILVLDNANSGTNNATTLDAARYARSITGIEELTLVIGQQAGDGAVCECFQHDQVLAAIESIRPSHLVWVGSFPDHETPEYVRMCVFVPAHAQTLDEGLELAKSKTTRGSIVLAVKTWR